MRLSWISGVLLWLASMGAMAAAGLPDYYPGTFERVGMINEVLANERVLVIDGVRVPIRPTLRVLTERTRNETVDALRTGMKVGFDGGSEPLTRIWVLPLDWPAPPR